MDNTQHKELTHISLCAGYGGIDLGLTRAIGFVRTVCFVEIEAFAIANLVSKIENNLLDEAPIWSDLKTFPWSSFRGKVDILSGGFPCQPFSGAGRKSSDEDPRHLWPHIVKGIRGLDYPPIVFFENVEGILSSKLKSDGWSDPKGTGVLQHVLRELERLGYRATAGVFSASEVGAPHQRKRVFILGVHTKLNALGRSDISGQLSDKRWLAVENSYDSRRPRLKEYGSSKNKDAPQSGETSAISASRSNRASQAWPSRRGCDQLDWEPPQTYHSPNELVNSDSEGLERSGGPSLQGRDSRLALTDRGFRESESRKTQPSMGRDTNGSSDWLGFSELRTAVDNRTDELRSLGNGVVPQSAERAFCYLWSKLEYTKS